MLSVQSSARYDCPEAVDEADVEVVGKADGLPYLLGQFKLHVVNFVHHHFLSKM